MILIKPITVTDSNLLSSSIAEPDATQGEPSLWSSGSYNLGDRVIENHRIYECTADPDTTDQPSVGALKEIPTWVDIAPTNKFAMFDNVNSTTSKAASQIVVEIDDPLLINGLAGFNISGATSINIRVTDPVAGVVYDKNISMVDNSEVVDWYSYYFSDIVQISQFLKLDLPAYVNAVVRLEINGTNIKIGTFVLGNQKNLGVANIGSSVQLLDFSKKETDSFGNFVVKKGRNSKLVNYDVTINKSRVNYVFDLISSITTVPAVWIGADDSNDPSIVYGYYRDFQDNINSHTLTSATIQVEGLV